MVTQGNSLVSTVILVDKLVLIIDVWIREGKELKALHYASAVVLYNDYVTTCNIVPTLATLLL